MVKLFSAEIGYTAPERSHCNDCAGSRRHDILNVQEHNWADDEVGISGGDAYFIVKCRGCETTHFRHDSWFSEHTDAEGEPIPTVRYYPPASSRSTPKWLTSLDGPFRSGTSIVSDLLEEIYVSLYAGSRRLAAMGIRALLEHVMIEKVGDNGSFEANIKAFFAAGYVAVVDQPDFRDKLIDAGHAAMHRNYAPELDDLDVLMRLTESLVERIYVHPHISSRLDGKIPARPARQPKRVKTEPSGEQT